VSNSQEQRTRRPEYGSDYDECFGWEWLVVFRECLVNRLAFEDEGNGGRRFKDL